ncbi:hypothetical protein WJX84_008366 [Apatococcus fuscideae]|uniref:S-acyltransferase n=1 Tax=Apatococcus fuscideae TaxID=2026836 RepID=A0AAW1TH05_9CHLO
MQSRNPVHRRLTRHWPILVFTLGNGGGTIMCYFLDTTLTSSFKGVWSGSPRAQTLCQIYTSIFFLLMSILWWLYWSLYQSNPGFVTLGSGDVPSQGLQRQCPYCRCAPPLRSRHDHQTGRCVVKFDHFCSMLQTPIGDLNHARFWLFVVLQAFFAMWGTCVCWEATTCLQPLYNRTAQVACWKVHPGRTVLLLLFVLFTSSAAQGLSGLAMGHSYLACTAQTTYELLKGAKVSYLASHYASYDGPQMLPHRVRGVRLLLRQHLKFRHPPPAPFNQGVIENLNSFFFQPKPIAYHEQYRYAGTVSQL